MKIPKQVWSAAEFILENYEIQRLICGNFCVPDEDIAFTVFFKSRSLGAPVSNMVKLMDCPLMW